MRNFEPADVGQVFTTRDGQHRLRLLELLYTCVALPVKAPAVVQPVAMLSPNDSPQAVLQIRNRIAYQINGEPWPSTYFAEHPEVWAIDL